MLSSSTWPSISANSQAIDYTHCVPDIKVLNFFPTKGGISDTLIPKTIMSGEILDYKKHLSLQIGQYCQVHEEDAPRKSQNTRTKGAISLGPSGNLQGGFKFMALNKGKKIVRGSWDVILMPDTVITRVNALGSNQPEQLVFTNRRGRPIGNVKIPGVDTSNADHIEIPGVDALDIDVENIEIPGVDVDIQEPQVIEIIDPDIPPTDPDPIEPAKVQQADASVEPMLAIQQVDPKLRRSSRVRTQTEKYTPSVSGYKYSYAVTQLESQGVLNPDAHMFVQEEFYQAEPDVVASVMTQLSLQSDLRA